MTQRINASPGDLRSILRSVSRSFFISMRLLPRPLQEPVQLGYLLARATDTLADTAGVPALVREETLLALSGVIQGERPPSQIAEVQSKFVPLQTNAAEKRLLEALPQCLEILARLNSSDRGDIRTVLDKITRAQRMDVVFFDEKNSPRALPSATELRGYAYLIAGCVGEFWTNVCARHLPDFAGLPDPTMADLGRQYGIGLQLINIIRDAATDLKVGRCYFPEDELKANGLEAGRILDEPERFEPVVDKWLGEAERDLRAGMEYVDVIRNRRVRAATALPALIGARTINLLRAAGARALQQQIKMPRSEVRGVIGAVALNLAGRKALREMFQRELDRPNY